MAKKKICIVQLGPIGDLLLITPMFRALKQAHPEYELHLLAGRRNYPVVRNNPYIDHVHVYTKRFWSTMRLFFRLRVSRFDVWLDPKEHHSSESNMFGRVAGARMKIGFRGSRVFTHSSVEQRPGGEHYTLRSLRNLEQLGVTATEVRPVAPPTPQQDAAFDRFREENGIGAYCAVNVSASRGDRYWQQEKWIRLLQNIQGTFAHFVFTCMPQDRGMVDAIISRVPAACVYPTRTILDTFPLIGKSQLVLSVDTSVIHIAAAFNKPVVALYVNLPEFFKQYLPLSDKSRVVMHPDKGAPVGMIEVEQVKQAFEELLSEIK